MAVLLREPTPDDAAELGRVHQQCWVETYAHLVPAEFWEHSTEARRIGMWERMLRRSDPNRRLVLAEADGDVVGFALVGAALAREHPGAPPAEALEVRMLYLRRSWHGTGVGQQLLDTVLLTGEAAQVWVAERNSRAQAFYRRNGFVTDGIRDPDAHQGTDLAAIRMLRAPSAG